MTLIDSLTGDWSRTAVVASGPSAKAAGVDQLRGLTKVIAVNDGYDLCPWADAVYGCDGNWWRARQGLSAFKGVKIAWRGEPSQPAARYPDLLLVDIDKRRDDLLLDQLGVLGSGGNSGFQALNLALQLGARQIVLVGFDCHGGHFFGRHIAPGLHNPTEENFKRWRKAYDGVAADQRVRGVEIWNAAMDSTIKAFHKATIAAILEKWRLKEAA